MTGTEQASFLSSIGLLEKEYSKFVTNEQLCTRIREVVDESGLKAAEDGTRCQRDQGILLYAVASKVPPTAVHHSGVIARMIGSGTLKQAAQVDAAIAYAKKHNMDETLCEEALKKECGVGVNLSDDDVRTAVLGAIESYKDSILERRYHFKFNVMIGAIRRHSADMKWADAAVVSRIMDEEILKLLGPKTAEDEAEAPKAKKKKEKEKKPAKAAAAAEEEKPQESLRTFISRDMSVAKNTANWVAKHKEITGGRIQTRFPPEPNGYLHIGHAKAMNLDFGYANETDGVCYLRFDDTNPDKETPEYIESIKQSVAWLGYKPWKITHSSDYFQELYDLAIKLIKDGNAYVCHQNKEDMRKGRQEGIDSPFRNRSVEENLKEFEKMRTGMYKEGEAVLRVKGDMQSANMNMRDFVAYRIKFKPHPHAGDKWCIYPSYDYTHCLVDSLEHITHSLCTLEFETRRESYYWLLDVLDLYKPHVWEFSRLNISYTVMSKRKMDYLVQQKMVHGWDDPRLMTLDGLRRRGYTKEAINEFCKQIGVTRNENTISMNLLEHCCRQDLDNRCPRAFAILDPIKVVMTNWPESEVEELEAANHPKDKSMGTHKKTISRVLYIDSSDFREVDSKDYFGLAPNKTVGLRYAYNIHCDEVVKGTSGEIVELRCTVDKKKTTKPKGHIQWVAEPSPGKEPVKAEVRLYELLFTEENPSAAPDWLKIINPNSEQIKTDCYVDAHLRSAGVFEHFQFERVGFFVVDTDSTSEKLVFNRTVSLREAKELKTAKGKK